MLCGYALCHNHGANADLPTEAHQGKYRTDQSFNRVCLPLKRQLHAANESGGDSEPEGRQREGDGIGNARCDRHTKARDEPTRCAWTQHLGQHHRNMPNAHILADVLALWKYSQRQGPIDRAICTIGAAEHQDDRYHQK
jgi:hypothetical protein